MFNGTMMQYFHWFLPSDCKLWNQIYNQAESLNKLGITSIWLPPAYKGMAGKDDVGYGVYDLYDLGEFFQKGVVETKYGSKEEYIKAIEELHKFSIQAYGDIVLNHKMGADFTEEITCKEVNSQNRNDEISDEIAITAWTKFEFKNRDNKYSDFKWNHNHFHGVDYDEKTKKIALYKFKDKNWNEDVDKENGNYDYLMGCDIDFSSEEVKDELKKWGHWYLDTTNLDGLRLDAVKHISSHFYLQWIKELRNYTGKELFSVGEYWHYDVEVLLKYIKDTEGVMSLFDVPLHYNFYDASHNDNYDMRNIFKNTLVSKEPIKAVTFVDNHDTQIGAALETWVNPWFKPLAYALILLRDEGYPCVFYGDYYGIDKDNYPGIGDVLEKLLFIRKDYAFGVQHDYFDDKNVVGWTREGVEQYKNSGIAVLISTGEFGSKKMYIGAKFAGNVFVDILNGREEEVKIDSDGFGEFFVNEKSVSVWKLK